jgi:hypothetical protein
VRSDRWHEITTHHADLLANIEGTILETARDVTGLCDHWTHLGLIGAMRDDMPDHPCSLMLYEAIKKLRQGRDDVADDLWLDALRVVDQSVRDHSSLRHGDRSYLSFIGAFFEHADIPAPSKKHVTQQRIHRPLLDVSASGDVVIGFAWYRREQWPELRSFAADADKLEETYDEWLAGANKVLEDLRYKGIRAEKVDVEIYELSAWCKSRGLPLDSDARATFAGEKMRQE